MRSLSTTDSLICYSLGPDKRDNRATVAYDPTNGTISVGDIWVRVPRRRQYPFPRAGVRAASKEDLLRQFPNGRPADPFASTRGKPLGIAKTSVGEIFIFSYGPDVDEFKPEYTGYRTAAAVRPTTTTAPPAGYSPWIYLSPAETRAPAAPRERRHPQVAYDPTNGTVSEGDLFIRVPRR